MKVIIIGGQAAGMTVATRLKRNNPSAEVIVYEKESYVSFGACGLPYYVGDFFHNPDNMFAKSKEDLEKSRLKIFTNHEVIAIDANDKSIAVINKATKISSTEIYDKLIVCSGASARDLSECNGQNIFTLQKLTDAQTIKDLVKISKIKDVVIVGAGYIGLELLEAFAEYPIRITIMDVKKSLSDNLMDKDFEDVLQHEIKKHNINLLLETSVLSIKSASNNEVVINYTKDNKSFTITTNLVILAKGFIPNTSFLDNKIFKKLENGALLVNQVGETSVEDIYALGDCASIYHKILKKDLFIPLATIANKMGRVVADSIVGKNNCFKGTIGSSMLKILDLEVAKTGITEYEAQKYSIPYNATFVEDYNHTNYYPMNAKLFMKILTNPENNQIIGAQIVGKHSGCLRIHALSVAVEKGLTAEELGMLDFAYAPPFTRTWEALNILGNVATKKK